MATNITFKHYWTDKDGQLGAPGTVYAPGTVAAAAADVIAQQLIHAYIAVLSSGAPTSSPATIDTTRILAGAGKVTVADADFVASDKVSDGMQVFVRNTTDSSVRHASRVAGVWKVSPAYT